MSTTGELVWNLDGIGVWSEPTEFEVTRERIVQYAEATNDEHPAHRSGDLAPPVFAIVPAFAVVVPAIIPLIPQEVVMRGVHGQQEFRYHRPIHPGTTLVSRAAPLGVASRSTGAVVLGKTETRTQDGDLVVEQWMTYFVRGAEFGESVGEPLPEHAFPEELRGADPVAAVTHGYDPDQTHRYSAASGDPMPIHLDDEFAKSMGLPGIIVHGMCTMAFTSRAVIQTLCPEDPTRLRRLAVRFAQIVQPSEQVTTTMWDAGGGAVAFETTSDAGGVAVKDGLAEIAA